MQGREKEHGFRKERVCNSGRWVSHYLKSWQRGDRGLEREGDHQHSSIHRNKADEHPRGGGAEVLGEDACKDRAPGVQVENKNKEES